jgi:hypothetical protein
MYFERFCEKYPFFKTIVHAATHFINVLMRSAAVLRIKNQHVASLSVGVVPLLFIWTKLYPVSIDNGADGGTYACNTSWQLQLVTTAIWRPTLTSTAGRRIHARV